MVEVEKMNYASSVLPAKGRTLLSPGALFPSVVGVEEQDAPSNKKDDHCCHIKAGAALPGIALIAT
jgi:hypothetical protein